MVQIFRGPLVNPTFMVVGEAPGVEEEKTGVPFVGTSGQELSRMLAEAGIPEDTCYITNVTSVRPPGNEIDLFYYTNKEAKLLGARPVYGRYPKAELSAGVNELHTSVQKLLPRVIIACGDTALWALTGKSGIQKWRGSVLPCIIDPDIKVIPTYHPAAILRMWSWRYLAVQDFRRALKESAFSGIRRPPWEFLVRPSYTAVMARLDWLLANPRKIVADIETKKGKIVCLGIAWSKLEAICIPFWDPHREDKNYWSYIDELSIRMKLRRVLRELPVIFHNAMYDCQYFAAEDGIQANVAGDTMIKQHVAFAGMKKSLDFCASLYCEYYCYWKDDGKEWDTSIPIEQLWGYNCEDCVRTYEVDEVLDEVLDKFDLQQQYEFQIKRLLPKIFKMALHGCLIDEITRKSEAKKLGDRMADILKWIEAAVGHPFNPNSNPQMITLFYDDFRAPRQRHKKTGALSLDEVALERIAQKMPILKPLCEKIVEFRSLKTLKSTFMESQASEDGRMRCSWNLTGAETYRFSSSQDVFGSGMNMQNIPKEKPSKHKMIELDRPNVRKFWIPDPGHTIVDADLERADAAVVAWDAGDEKMKQIIREGYDLWTEAVKDCYGIQNFDKKLHHNYRQMCKQGGHATDYGASARTIAIALGVTIHEAEDFQKRWFASFPGIRLWHQRVAMDLMTKRFVVNAFGYRRFYFDRIESLLPEALAWIPQSTVGIAINHALCQAKETIPEFDLLLQVHDSIVGQVKTELLASILPRLAEAMKVTIPYEDPLVIRSTIDMSSVCWGDVSEAPKELLLAA